MEKDNVFILVGICLIGLILGLLLVEPKDFNFVFAQETLSCEVRDYACGDPKPVEIFQMYSTSNSHAALPGQNYTYRVCCGGVTDLGNSCTEGKTAVVLRLSGTTNAHARQNSYGDYPGTNKTCISVPLGAGGSINVGYVAGDSTCAAGGYQTTLGSMSKATNAHVGNETAYTGASNYKICASFTPFSTAIEIKDQNSTINVSVITFPAGNPSTEVSNPSNGIGEPEQTQAFGASSLPVVTLVTATEYKAHITITSGTGWTDTATNENYYIDTAHARNITKASFDSSKSTYSSWGTDVDTGVTLATANANDLYLTIDLSTLWGKTGTSTFTILGETP